MPSTTPLSRTTSSTSSVMSRTVRPPDVRSLVSRWETLTGGILAEAGGQSTAEPPASREPAEGSQWSPPRSVRQLCFQATEKEPLLEIGPGCAFVGLPPEATILI